MLNTKQYLKRKGENIWCFSHDNRTIRESTVTALMRGGFITQGFELSNLTNNGRQIAINGTAKDQRAAAEACA